MQAVVCRAEPENLCIVPRQPLVLVPVRDLKITAMLSSMMSPTPSANRGPRPILPRTSAPRPPETPTSEGLSFSADTSRRGWATARGEQLRKKIEQRPSRERLLNQHILLSDGRVAPLIEQRARLLRQDRIRRNLSRKLESRPGPLELVTRKILQADADLEQAIEEGRVLFQPTSEYVEKKESEMPSPLSTDMEIVSQAAIRVQNKPVNVLSNKGLIRKKSTPYKQCDPLPLRAKTKAPDSREDDEVTVIAEVRSPVEETAKACEQNSYELLLQQQKLFLQWQHNDDNPALSQDEQMQYDMQPISRTSSPPTQVTVRRLSDYKVQELKNECKKRQLPVSGAKPQLLERLRPFEKAILGASPSPTPEPAQLSNSSSSSTTSNTSQEGQQPPAQEVLEPIMQTEPAANCQLQTPTQVSEYPTEHIRSTVGIPDYLGRPVVLQLSPQLVQLTDSKGTPVGVASVQYIPGSGHPVMLSYHSRGTPQPNISQPIASIQPDTTATNTQRRVTHILPLQQGPLSAHTQQTVVTNIPSLAQPGIVQATQVVQKQNDNTFRFAQMGSGGQFTVAPSTDKVPNKSAPVVMKTTDHVGAPQTSLASSNPSIANIVEINPPSSQLATTGVPTTPLIVSFQPTATGYHTSPQNNSNPNSYQTAVAQNGFACEGMNPCVQDSPRTADLAGDSPHMPNSGQSETVAETGDGTIENPITFDDPSSILTPAALSMHEEMLRAQQKKIEMLLEELAKSQAHLKREQQLILTAKKAQQRIRERQRENATNREREQWLRELDVGHINKQHIQHFLQHKKQQATLQRHSMEHNRLTTTEARLQEELHVEQAVQDIVRLIKQDPRTALLIVQLLRRYQLERNAEQQQASSPDTDKLSQVNSPASATRDSQARNTCEIESRNCEGQTNVIENDQQSVVIYDASGIQLNHDRIFVCQQNTSVVQEEEKSQSVDMEEIFKSVLEDASRAINNDVTAAQSVDCTMSNNAEQSQQTMVICHQQWQQPVQLSEMEMEGSLIENTNQPQQVVSHAMMNAEANIVQQPTVMNSAQNYDQQTHHVGYSQDIEDLMAVLRDDQDGGMKPGSFQMDLGVGYGSEELADLLGEDWLDCADRSIANNGQYAPYESESHDGVGGRSTDPMCMQSHSEVGVGDQNMDWLDVMLQNAPIEQRPYGST